MRYACPVNEYNGDIDRHADFGTGKMRSPSETGGKLFDIFVLRLQSGFSAIQLQLNMTPDFRQRSSLSYFMGTLTPFLARIEVSALLSTHIVSPTKRSIFLIQELFREPTLLTFGDDMLFRVSVEKRQPSREMRTCTRKEIIIVSMIRESWRQSLKIEDAGSRATRRTMASRTTPDQGHRRDLERL